MSFFWIWQKNSPVCRNSNLNVQRKKTLERLVFCLSWTWKEKRVFLPKSFWKVCQNYFRRVQRNTYREKFLKGSLENLRIFGKLLKNSGQWGKTFLRFGKTAIDVRGTVYGKKIFKSGKFAIFSDSERNFPFSCEKFRQICETRNLGIRGSFWGKTFLEIFL